MLRASSTRRHGSCSSSSSSRDQQQQRVAASSYPHCTVEAAAGAVASVGGNTAGIFSWIFLHKLFFVIVTKTAVGIVHVFFWICFLYDCKLLCNSSSTTSAVYSQTHDAAVRCYIDITQRLMREKNGRRSTQTSN